MDKGDDDVVCLDSSNLAGFFKCLSEYTDKPLMMLFKRLIGNDSKQNTVLTNAQIVEILQKEFSMDVLYVHELELDIYLNILKKFLKDWPQWDEFDTAINTLKYQNDTEQINYMLKTNYESLKSYLHKTLKAVEPILTKTIKDIKKSMQKERKLDVLVQIQCTRRQLNQLVFRRPHPFFHHTIFNINDPPAPLAPNFPIDCILNWPNMRISLFTNGTLIFKRETIMSLHHVLMNRKLNCAPGPPTIFKTNYQMRGMKTESATLVSFMDRINDIEAKTYCNPDLQRLVEAVCNVLKEDMADAPRMLYSPITYRRYLNRTPYVRYLCSDININDPVTVNNYDLCIEETGAPQVQIMFVRFTGAYKIDDEASFLKIDCGICRVYFSGQSMLEDMYNHFKLHHWGEPDWKCPRCELMFSMEYLIKMRWKHMCEPSADSNYRS